MKSAISFPSLQPKPLADLLLSRVGADRGKLGAVFICARQDGRKLDSRTYAGASWSTSLVRGLGEVDFTKTTSLEIALSFNWRKVKDFDRTFGEIHKGIRGIRLTAASNSRTLFPSEMVATNTTFQRARERFADANKGVEIAIDTFDTVQFLLFPQKQLLVPVYRGNQVVELEEVTRENVANAARLMGEWMANNVDAHGALTYKYWPSKGEYSGSNNMVRQFMGTVCLYQAAAFFNSDFVRRKAELNLAYNLARYFRRDGRLGYVDDVGLAKLGAAALAAMAVLHDDGERFADQEDRLFKLTKHLQQSDGSFITYYGTDSTRNQNFYPGECLLYWSFRLRREWSPALYERFRRSFRYYRVWHIANRNPAFVPWHTQACFMLYGLKKDQQLKDWIFEMNDWLLPFQQWDQVKADDCKGRFYDPDKPWGPPHASATGVYLEGLADAFQLAVDEGDAKRANAYVLVIKRALRDVLQLQFRTDVDMFYISKRERVIGGLRTTEYNNEIRVDNVQHNLMALMKLLANRDFPW